MYRALVTSPTEDKGDSERVHIDIRVHSTDGYALLEIEGGTKTPLGLSVKLGYEEIADVARTINATLYQASRHGRS